MCRGFIFCAAGRLLVLYSYALHSCINMLIQGIALMCLCLRFGVVLRILSKQYSTEYHCELLTDFIIDL